MPCNPSSGLGGLASEHHLDAEARPRMVSQGYRPPDQLVPAPVQAWTKREALNVHRPCSLTHGYQGNGTLLLILASNAVCAASPDLAAHSEAWGEAPGIRSPMRVRKWPPCGRHTRLWHGWGRLQSLPPRCLAAAGNLAAPRWPGRPARRGHAASLPPPPHLPPLQHQTAVLAGARQVPQAAMPGPERCTDERRRGAGPAAGGAGRAGARRGAGAGMGGERGGRRGVAGGGGGGPGGGDDAGAGKAEELSPGGRPAHVPAAAPPRRPDRQAGIQNESRVRDVGGVSGILFTPTHPPLNPTPPKPKPGRGKPSQPLRAEYMEAGWLQLHQEVHAFPNPAGARCLTRVVGRCSGDGRASGGSAHCASPPRPPRVAAPALPPVSSSVAPEAR